MAEINSQTNNQQIPIAPVGVKPAAPVAPGAPAPLMSTSPAQAAKPATPATPPASSAPIFQASPSGGVVATLRPGQASFEGAIRTESNRKTGKADDRMTGLAMTATAPMATVKLQQSSAPLPAATPEPPKAAPKPPEAPKSVRNFKVGAERPEAKPINWVLILVSAGLVLIAALIIYFYLGQRRRQQPTPEPEVPEQEVVILNYWGLWEPNATFNQVLDDFARENEGISVMYKKQDIDNYLSQLQSALASGNGPDVFRYHASWRKMLEGKLSTMPSDLMSSNQFDATFYPVAGQQLKNDAGQIQGIPLMYDSLALIYNQALFDEAGVEVPETWAQFKQASLLLTKDGADGSIVQAGAAMGLMDNIDFSSDIIMLLALQNGMTDAYEQDKLQTAITYYTDYYNIYDEQVWDETFENSTLDFARGKVAMILAPSWLIHDIIKINPTLSIGVAPAPQLDPEMPIDWATYYAEGVNAQAKPEYQLAAWKLLKYLSQPEVLEKLYGVQAEERSFGEIYPRQDMADKLAKNRYVQPYLTRAMYGRNLPFNDRTFDGAVNDDGKAILSQSVRAVTGDELMIGSDTTSERILEMLAGYGYVTLSE